MLRHQLNVLLSVKLFVAHMMTAIISKSNGRLLKQANLTPEVAAVQTAIVVLTTTAAQTVAAAQAVIVDQI